MRRSFAARGGWWVVGQGLLLVALVAALPWSVDWPVWVAAVGAALTVAGSVLLWAGATGLAGALTPYPEPKQGSRMVDTGAYGLVRHPIYGGVGLFAIGVALLARSPHSVAVGLVLIAYLTVKSVSEERRLDAAHPDYAEYRRKVRRRLIPWLW